MPYLLTFLCINFYCSEFNNPVKPTHIFSYCYKLYYPQYNVTIYPTKAIFQSWSLLYPIMNDPIFTLYLETNVDFSKKYPPLNEQNSNFIYKVFLDSIIDSIGANNNLIQIYQYEIILSSTEKDSSDTTYYKSQKYNNYIVISLNNAFMNYPKQFLWQTQLVQLDKYTLPPEPYAYIISDSIITY